METQSDVLRNPESFAQIGDLVAFSFLLTSFALLAVSIFILIQLRSVSSRWRTPMILGFIVTAISSVSAFVRRDYWIVTETNPVEFRFVDWFLTVPLMAIIFYYILKPVGARRSMVVRLFVAALWMLLWGYLGEAIQPYNSMTWGILGTLGFAAIIAMIMIEGYPRVMKPEINPLFRKGYVFLSIFLPFSWTAYPIGYMTVPGNLLEGVVSVEAVSVMFNIADILAKGGLALGVYYLASRVGDQHWLVEETDTESEYQAPADHFQTKPLRPRRSRNGRFTSNNPQKQDA
ncbi:MAG: bacteriorhodopsin [Bacteroidota bacterium]